MTPTPSADSTAFDWLPGPVKIGETMAQERRQAEPGLIKQHT